MFINHKRNQYFLFQNKRNIYANPETPSEQIGPPKSGEVEATAVVNQELNKDLKAASEGKRFQIEADYGETTGLSGLKNGDDRLDDYTSVVSLTGKMKLTDKSAPGYLAATVPLKYTYMDKTIQPTKASPTMIDYTGHKVGAGLGLEIGYDLGGVRPNIGGAVLGEVGNVDVLTVNKKSISDITQSANGASVVVGGGVNVDVLGPLYVTAKGQVTAPLTDSVQGTQIGGSVGLGAQF